MDRVAGMGGAAGMGRVALVTGASAGIGQATADHLAARGWTVVGASRRGTGTNIGPGPTTTTTTTTTTTGAGAGAAPTPPAPSWVTVVMDVDDDESVRAGVERVVEEHGGLAAVVACAGWGLAGAVEQTPIDEAKQQFETNFWGVVRVVQAALPVMRHRGGGRLVLVSSIGGVVALPFQAFYSASKFALEGYAEALAYEVAPFGIEVTLVQPGNVRTGFTAARRDVVPPAQEDPYRVAVAKSIDLMARDELNGVPAADVAAVIARALERPRPPRRISVGKAGERVGVVAKRLLPFRLFERAAKGSLGV